jgi:hypothetical protein
MAATEVTASISTSTTAAAMACTSGAEEAATSVCFDVHD